MYALVLALDHPYFAVTGEDGAFRIDNIPTGKWELVFWHEESGYLGTDKYPRGREIIEVPAGKLDLGEVRVAAKTLTPEMKPDPNAPEKKDVGWIDGQHGLQYRFRTPDHALDAAGVRTLARGELPLIYTPRGRK